MPVGDPFGKVMAVGGWKATGLIVTRMRVMIDPVDMNLTSARGGSVTCQHSRVDGDQERLHHDSYHSRLCC
jgi:hypothetical protein